LLLAKAYKLAVLMLLLAVAGCGYRFAADGGSRLDAGQTVWVAYFKNDTIYPQAAVLLKRSLFERFAAMRGISPAGSKEEGDLLVDGVITGYGVNAVSYSATDIVKEYRLIISAEVTIRRKGDKPDAKPLWKGTVSARQDYLADTNIELQRNREDAALLAASRKMSQQIIWALEQNY
jgi:hypothetical protein